MSSQPSSDYQVDLSQWKTNWDTSTKLYRGIWQFLVRPIYRLIPGRRAKLRIQILRWMGATIGENCIIEPHVDILIPKNLELGDYVAIGHHARILNFAQVRIGSMSVISQYAYLCTGTHDTSHPNFELLFKPIAVEPESWIASGAFVSPGITIGRGAVIGANSVVTKDAPEWHICAGNPCRPLKPREIKQKQ